jgi:hypothetical protein
MASFGESIGKRVLKNKKKGLIRQVKVHNFNTARSAVLLFDTGNRESFQVIKDFRKFLKDKGIRCSAYGYVAEKVIPQEMLFWKNYSFITRKNVNWFKKPFGEAVEAFFGEDPDILFDFTLSQLLELQFLVHLSDARFKVGCYTEQDNDYDLMINLTQQCSVEILAEQFKRYIEMLEPANGNAHEKK